MPQISLNARSLPFPQLFDTIKRCVIYIRVSTKRQGRSGLGLDTQDEAVTLFLRYNPMEIDRTFYEVESGGDNDRPVLRRALRHCKKTGAVLIIARIDRLSRDALFVADLINRGVHIIAADKPLATPLELLEDAIRAQRVREGIRRETKAALQRAKARGVILGKHGRYVLSKKNKEAADRFAEKLHPTIYAMKEGGMTLQEIASELNGRKIKTFQGGRHKWHVTTVFNLLARINKNLKTQNEENNASSGIAHAENDIHVRIPDGCILQQGRSGEGGQSPRIEDDRLRPDVECGKGMVDIRSQSHFLQFDWRHGFNRNAAVSGVGGKNVVQQEHRILGRAGNLHGGATPVDLHAGQRRLDAERSDADAHAHLFRCSRHLHGGEGRDMADHPS